MTFSKEESPFPLKLKGEFVGNGKWKLTHPFAFNSKVFGRIDIPNRFVTDGASIPKFLWSIVGSPWSGKYAEAAIPHDWGYHKQKLTRKQYDLVFLEAMKVLKVPFWKRRLMYQAVRIAGFIPWNKRVSKKSGVFGHFG